jgi:hypothetical protein
MQQANETKAVLESALRVYEAERIEIMQQIAVLHARLKDVQSTQASLRKRIDGDAPSRLILPPRSQVLKYTRLSVRWAILDLLNGSEGMTTSEIADALQKGGIQTRATNFANNVSSVLTTTMLKDHHEVEQLTDGTARWKLTMNGVSAISYLKTTEKFQRACGSWNAHPERG